jgi:Ni/Co efflux regulator RcnB
MKKQLGVFAFCTAMLLSSSLAFAQDDHRPGPPPGDHHSLHDEGVRDGWYKKGGHLPTSYRSNDYVVGNWRAEHLHQPPRGYHWVRSDNGDFLLVAVTTGVISSIVAAAVH